MEYVLVAASATVQAQHPCTADFRHPLGYTLSMNIPFVLVNIDTQVWRKFSQDKVQRFSRTAAASLYAAQFHANIVLDNTLKLVTLKLITKISHVLKLNTLKLSTLKLVTY